MMINPPFIEYTTLLEVLDKTYPKFEFSVKIINGVRYTKVLENCWVGDGMLKEVLKQLKSG